MLTQELSPLINLGFEDRSLLVRPEVREAVEETIRGLDRGELRSAEPAGAEWVVNRWIIKAILLFYRVRGLETIELGPYQYRDRIPLKHQDATLHSRVVPGAIVRYGAYLSPKVILMPSFVNIGAWIGPGTMVDTWATVGSCAQVGARVHLAGGVGIGGVLEPPNDRPVIVEDDVFIGSRAVVTEGVIIGAGAILGANVALTASTPVIDVTGTNPVEYRGRVPNGAIVIPGTRQRPFPAGTFGVVTGLIIGWRSELQDHRVSLNQALREFDLEGSV